MKNTIAIFISALFFFSCTKEYACANLQIQPSFIGFTASDIDTFILRKYKENDNFQNLIDTFRVTYAYFGNYQSSGDTTSVFISDGKNGIEDGFDWQIFLPAKNRTVYISEIAGEKKTGKCGYGLFSMDKFACNCTNSLYSAKADNQLFNYSVSDSLGPHLFIHN